MKTKKKSLILGGDPEAKFKVPAKEAFLDGEFLEADELGQIGQALIESRPVFASLADAKVIYLWKRKATEKPRRLLGKCQRPSGLLRHFSNADFVVWLAANNCQGFTAWQVEALVFHELKHARMDEDAVPVLVPHDWEGFVEEIERYGLWKGDIRPIAEAGEKALKLPFDEPKPLSQLDGVTITLKDGTQGTVHVGPEACQ